MRLLLSLLAFFLCVNTSSYAQNLFPDEIATTNDENESLPVEVLLEEAEQLFIEDRPLDARTKLLAVLKKDPENYRAHTLLSSYYLVHVGHFRLALKYIKKAMAVFKDERGPAPYTTLEDKLQHAHQLHLLSQARLNLDDYEGALSALEQYEKAGYYQDWYPGSKAWVLMKLGRLSDAIKVARLGLLSGGEQGRTLNILGILLSMTGDREQSLQVFKQAISYELSMGSMGQPATPLNNSGEVYREIFEEQNAEKFWSKAVTLPDGCEHILPSLNLAIVKLEKLDLKQASKSIDNFEACVAQYPLRNGEEHRALVHFARGRIALYAGQIDEAIDHFQKTLVRRQWFGKIGASVHDLSIAANLSLAESYDAKRNRLELSKTAGTLASVKSLWERNELQFKSWWLKRRARQILIEDLNDAEDVFVRHTDSVLDYSYLGYVFEEMDSKLVRKKIASIASKDKRSAAQVYYDSYLYLSGSSKSEKLSSLLQRTRPDYDAALQLRLLVHAAAETSRSSNNYRLLANKIFRLSPPALANAGLPLPVNLSTGDQNIEADLKKSAFLVSNSLKNEHIISHTFVDGEHTLKFFSRSGGGYKFTVRGGNFTDVINQLTHTVFRITLSS